MNFVSCTTLLFGRGSFLESIVHDFVIQLDDLLFNTCLVIDLTGLVEVTKTDFKMRLAVTISLA